VELFRKSSGKSSGGVLKMLFSDKSGILSGTTAKQRRQNITRILGYDPRGAGEANGDAQAVREAANVEDLLEGMQQMMTSQMKRMCFVGWIQVRGWACAAACFGKERLGSQALSTSACSLLVVYAA
jgi:hypothetical protein